MSFKKSTGEIIEVIQDDQDIDIYYGEYSIDFKNDLGHIHVDSFPRNLDNYKVVNDEIVKRESEEIYELRRYKRILTDEERLLNSLKPTKKDIDKAEQTIEILSLIQEVL